VDGGPELHVGAGAADLLVTAEQTLADEAGVRGDPARADVPPLDVQLDPVQRVPARDEMKAGLGDRRAIDAQRRKNDGRPRVESGRLK